MKVQAISMFNPVIRCQPVNRVSYAKKQVPEVKTTPAQDFGKVGADSAELKYDFACRLAAYYKNQYENLLKNGSCVV